MRQSEGKFVGLWIDHRKAVVVRIDGQKVTVAHIESAVEGHFRLKGGAPSCTCYGSQAVVSESQRENRVQQQFRRYYQEVIKALRSANAIFIFGPGEAKLELKKEIRKSKELASRIVGIETTDKMTDNQIAAKVREAFGVGPRLDPSSTL